MLTGGFLVQNLVHLVTILSLIELVGFHPVIYRIGHLSKVVRLQSFSVHLPWIAALWTVQDQCRAGIQFPCWCVLGTYAKNDYYIAFCTWEIKKTFLEEVQLVIIGPVGCRFMGMHLKIWIEMLKLWIKILKIRIQIIWRQILKRIQTGSRRWYLI